MKRLVISILVLTTNSPLWANDVQNAALEQDAQEVLRLIQQSKTLRTKLPEFVQETNLSLEQHKGALPSAYSNKIARGLADANQIRSRLFNQAILHRNALYRVDNTISDNQRVKEMGLS